MNKRLDDYQQQIRETLDKGTLDTHYLIDLFTDPMRQCDRTRIVQTLYWDYQTLGDIAKATEAELLRKRGIGLTTVQHIKGALEKVGLSLTQ